MSIFSSTTRVPSKLNSETKTLLVFKERVNHLVRKVTVDITYPQ